MLASAALVAAAAAAASAPCTATARDLRVSGMPCGSGGVYSDEASPLLSWAPVFSPQPLANARQSAYRIVASTNASALGTGDAWDSGWVNSSATLEIEYRGGGLDAPGDTVFWSVWLADGSGAVCAPPSDGICALTAAPRGLPGFAALGARWIGESNAMPADECASYAEAPAPLLRRSFALPPGRTIASAHLFVTGLGFYAASLNGAPVGDLALDPAWTTVRARTLFSAFDVSAQLRAGSENVLGLTLGRGWYDPLPMKLFGAFNLREALTVGPPRAIAALIVCDGEGGRTIIASDAAAGGWRASDDGAIRRNNIYIGVEYDARRALALAGWDAPGFDASAWRPAVATAIAGGDAVARGALRLARAPGIRFTTSDAPTAIVPLPGAPHSYTVSFPRNIAGVVALRGVRAPAGAVTRLTFAEVLHPNGTINTVTNLAGSIGRWPGMDAGPCAPSPAEETDNVTWAGLPDGESFQPQFTWHAFQHARVDGWPTATAGPPTPAHFAALRLHVDNDPTGNEFVSWNPQHAAIDALAAASFRSNWAGGIQSDCPGRERLGYGGDLLDAADAAMMQFDLRAFYAKRVDDYADAQQANGGLPETAPYMGIRTCDLGNGTGPMQWGSGHSSVALQLWARYGARALLLDNYEAQRRWLALLRASANATAAGGLLLANGLQDFTQSTAADCVGDLS